MQRHNFKNTAPATTMHSERTKTITVPMFQVESEGFCVCPKCFHLVFDEMLTGKCPWCGNKFCPAFSGKRTTSD